ncbi:MAG: DUF3347 domain-containing protein [Ferruginibacter sp.]
MKKILFSLLAMGAIFLTSCNNNASTNDGPGEVTRNTTDTIQHAVEPTDEAVKNIAVTYTDLDAKVSASIKEIFDHYLVVKNALVGDNGNEAASGAQAMTKAITKIDKSLLTAEQKRVYDTDADKLTGPAATIANNGDKIKLQRAQFALMSEALYELAKAFGGGRDLYHDHCPMYNENKGAIWLSETKEVKNPYYGSEMLTCGTVQEIIK